MTHSAFYGSLYPDNSNSPSLSSQLAEIQSSGFDTVIMSLFHIGRDGTGNQVWGDLVYNNTPDIVASGGTIQTSFVGTDPSTDWASYINQLKNPQGGATTSVTKIYLSFGGQSPPVIDFGTIYDKFVEYLHTDPSGTKSGPYIPCDSWLFKNLQAIKAYLPMVDGIDIDQEEGTSQKYIDAMTAFGIAARAVGFDEITYVPPFGSSLDSYQSAAESVNAFAFDPTSLDIGGTSYPYAGFAYEAGSAPSPKTGFATRLGLQYYSGGFSGGNSAWVTAAGAIGAAGGGASPILLLGASATGSTASDVESFLSGNPSPAWQGGFIWEYGSFGKDASAFNQAIQDGVTS